MSAQNQTQAPDLKRFPPHWLPQQVSHNQDRLLQGVLRINQKSYQDAYVSSGDDLKGWPDVHIQGMRDRNRALQGDLVWVDLNPASKWSILEENIRDYLDAKKKAGQVLTEEDLALALGAQLQISDSEKKVKVVEAAETKINDQKIAPIASEVKAESQVNCNKVEEEDGTKKKKTRRGKRKKKNATTVATNEEEEAKENEEPSQPIEEPAITIPLPSEPPAQGSSSPSSAKADAKGPKKNKRTGKKKKADPKSAQNSTKDQPTPPTPNQTAQGSGAHPSPRPQPGAREHRHTPKTSVSSAYDLDTVMNHSCSYKFLQRTGRVVHIVEKNHSRKSAGNLTLYPDKNPNYALFKPLDSRVPRMKIPRDQWPQDFYARSQDYADNLYVAEIVKWDMVNAAMGKLLELLGNLKDVDTRSKAILSTHEIDDSEFPQAVIESLPEMPFKIPDEEFAKRRDFTKECVFTIDPLTARDLDDALSVEDLGDGRLRIGVHIADVSYFVREGSPVDQMAASRATSVYLVQNVIPMLPRPLCENLCSLNPGEDRLAFSVEWTMDSEGKILKEWFGRTVIRSCVKLAYEHAQGMLDEPDRKWTKEELPPVQAPWTFSDLSSRVNILQKIAIQLRKRREDNGALRLDQPKLSFTFDQETKIPKGYRLYEHRHSNKLIEEFMLLANISVATEIYKAFPDLAVLRSHPKPKSFMMNKTVDMLKNFDIDLDTESSKSLAESLSQYRGTDFSTQAKFFVLMSLCSKPMELARYFCSGVFSKDEEHKFHHYALSVPLYTHFTSPIRRYPDILVHRLLDAAIKKTKPRWLSHVINKQANHCNAKKLTAKQAGEESEKLFLALFIKECGPVEVKGMVLNVMDHALDVLLLDMATIKRVYMDKMDVKSFTSARNEKNILTMQLTWKSKDHQKPELTSKETLKLFSEVTVSLFYDGKEFDFQAVIELVGDLNITRFFRCIRQKDWAQLDSIYLPEV